MDLHYNGNRELCYWNAADQVNLSATEQLGTVQKIALNGGYYKILFEHSEASNVCRGLALEYQQSKREYKILFWFNPNNPNNADKIFAYVEYASNLIVVQNEGFKGFFALRIYKLYEGQYSDVDRFCFKCGKNSHLMKHCPLRKEIGNARRLYGSCSCEWCKNERNRRTITTQNHQYTNTMQTDEIHY